MRVKQRAFEIEAICFFCSSLQVFHCFAVVTFSALQLFDFHLLVEQCHIFTLFSLAVSDFQHCLVFVILVVCFPDVEIFLEITHFIPSTVPLLHFSSCLLVVVKNGSSKLLWMIAFSQVSCVSYGFITHHWTMVWMCT